MYKTDSGKTKKETDPRSVSFFYVYMDFDSFAGFDPNFLLSRGMSANISSVTAPPAKSISGAGIYSVVIASAPGFSSRMPRAAFMAFPMAGPISMGISTLNTILTP